MHHPHYAVFLDLDGTLMTHSQVPPQNVAAIAAVRSRGHKVYLNTGRSLACIPGHVTRLIRFDGIVAGVGSYVTHQDKVLLSRVIQEPLLQETAAYFWQKRYPHVFEGEEIMLYARMKAPADMPRAFYLDEQHTFAGTYRDVRITKATILGSLSDDDKAYLREAFTVYQHETYAEIALKGCSKAGGMQWILNHLALDRSHSIAIGDSANDEDMLRAAGISVAMGNATAEIKAICDHLTTDADQAGVAVALEKLLPG